MLTDCKPPKTCGSSFHEGYNCTCQGTTPRISPLYRMPKPFPTVLFNCCCYFLASLDLDWPLIISFCFTHCIHIVFPLCLPHLLQVFKHDNIIYSIVLYVTDLLFSQFAVSFVYDANVKTILITMLQLKKPKHTVYASDFS